MKHPRALAPAAGVASVALSLLLGASPLDAQCTGCANASFGPGFQRFGFEISPADFAIADFDRDGFLDAAVPSGTYEGSVVIHHGDGRGGFRPAAFAAIGQSTYPTTAAAADLNGDGFPDLIASKGFSQDFWILIADGLGGFGAPVTLSAGLVPRYVRAADLDSDGNVDLVAAGGSLSVLMGTGGGAFAPAVLLPVPDGVSDVAIADFDGDGILDLAAAGNALSMFIGTGSGTFVPGPVTPLADPARLILAAKLDPDGNVDLVASLGGFVLQPSVQVLLGEGNGGFTTGQTIDEGTQSPDLALGDLDGDGALDLLVGGLLKVYPGNGDGTFAAAVETKVAASAVRAADMTGDGRADAVAVWSGVYVMPGRPGTYLETPPTVSAGDGPAAELTAASLDADGAPDLVVPQGIDGTVSVFLGTGGGAFEPATDFPAGPFARFVVAARLDADAAVDLAVLDDHGVSVLLGAGDGTFGAPTDFAAGTFPSHAAAGDFNGDTKTDLVVLGFDAEILLGDGNGGFGAPSVLSDSSGSSVAVADLNHDGFQDIVVSMSVDLAVYLGHGNGTFDDAAFFYASGGADPLVLADFDGDGNLDAPVASTEGVAVLFGDGDGGFGPASPVVPGVSGRFAVGDYNQDGDLDLAMTADNGALVALGDGAGGFGPPAAWVSVNGVIAMAPGDFDGDGKLDLATLGFHDLATLLNTNCAIRRLGIAGQPSTCAAPGQPFPGQPSAGVYDDGGNVITCDTETVTASIVPETGTPGALLAGDTEVPAVAGVATYTDLSIGPVGVGYVLEFSHPLAGVTRSRALTVGDPPAPPEATNSGPFCQGQDLNLYATTVPGAVYRWSGPDGFFSTAQSPTIPAATPAAAGDYTVTALVDGCESAAATTTVEALPPAPGPAILGQNQVCYGSRLLLRVDGTAFHYTWYHDGLPIEGADGPTYTVTPAYYAQAGEYAVTANDETGCTTALSKPLTVSIVFCHAEAQALAVDPAGNGILDPGETAVIDPTWKNRDIVDLPLVGILGTFTGPIGPSYVVDDGTADYGTLAPQAAADCLAASGDCYAVTVTPSGPRPATHWDAYLDEGPGADPDHTWVLHVGGSFTDVPADHPFYRGVETALHNGITAGCSPTTYCLGSGVTRAQMAVFLLKAMFGADFDPGPAQGDVFADVPADAFAAAWIERLYYQGITSGCGNGNYCPNQVVTRAQMAVFLLRAAGTGVAPCTGLFADVSCPGGFAVDYIEQLYADGITGGCGVAPLLYCPDNPNTRGQMAVFLMRTFGLSAYGP